MLTLLTLTISMVMLYMVLQNTQLTGTQKRYKNSLDAAVGGVEIVTMDALPYLLAATGSFDSGTSSATYFRDSLLTSMTGLVGTSVDFNMLVSNKCLNTKLTKQNQDCITDCVAPNSTIDPKESPDF